MTVKIYRNHIYLTGNINSKLANKFIFKLIDHANTSNEPMYLHISSNGGDVYSALRIVDYIKGYQKPIITVGEGLVASAATLLLISGSTRLMTDHSRFLMHQIRCNGYEQETTHQDIEDNLYNFNSLNETIVKLYHQHSNLSINQVKRILKDEKEFDVKECISKKLIDGIYKPAI